MRRLGLSGLAAIMAAISLTAVGCADKKQLADLQAQYNDLSSQNQDLRAQLTQAKTREAELLSQVDAKDLQLSAKNQDVARLEAQLAEKPAAAAAAGGAWDIGKNADRVTVGSDILFAAGQASLTSAGKKALDKIVGDLKSKYAGKSVRVYGYTDNDPIRRTKKLWYDNLDLSANRAMAVTRYLMSKGISAENVETVAMGAAHFVAKNDTGANKAKNRRVEIVVIKG